MDASDLAAVLARARQGDGEAFRALVEQHSRSVFRLAFRMTGNEQDAEDVVQESFLRAYRQLGRFESRANFGTWLYRIASNCAVDLMRSRQARHDQSRSEPIDEAADTTTSDTPDPERMAGSAEIQRRVARALEALSPLERAAFTLRHYEGRSIDEISRALNLGTSAAKHSVFRAVKKLRVALEPVRELPAVTHYSEDDLILDHYGEGRRRADIEQHLAACGDCAGTFRQIAATLALVAAPEMPERDDRYGLEVWQRIRHQLPLQDAPFWTAWFRRDRFAFAGAAAAVVVVAAFAAGRLWQRPAIVRPSAVQSADASSDAGTRVRMAAIGDHLERSERVLLDVLNAHGAHADVRDAQAWAADLVDANRLYRQAAVRDGDTVVADVLDELERNLLEIVHGPSTLTPAQLDQLRVRLDAAALLFKVRVLHDELREREAAPASPRKTT